MNLLPSSPSSLAQPLPKHGDAALRLGLFGGRFDPIHCGHLLLAQQALEQLELDVIHFIPAASPVHKPAVVSAQARATMVEIATAAEPQFLVSYCELARDTLSYTIDTIREYHQAYPRASLFFLLGADAYADFPSWEGATEIMELATMVVLAREPVVLEDLSHLPPPFNQATLLATPRFDISSSDIRARLQQQQPIRFRVPLEVEHYLAKYQPYRQP